MAIDAQEILNIKRNKRKVLTLGNYCRDHKEQPLLKSSALYTENSTSSPKHMRRVKNKQLIIASNSQEIPTTKRNKRKVLTLENYYKEKIQSTEETGEEDKQTTMPNPPPQNEK